MRTTVNMDDGLLLRLRRAAARSRLPFGEALDRALRAGLEPVDPRPRAESYRCTTLSRGYPQGIDMNKALQIAALLEDEETICELAVRK
jgi:hypothetical protein